MPVKLVDLISIEGKRFSKRGEKFKNIRIDHNTTITQVIELNDREVSIEFRHTINYTSIGMIRVEGNVVYEGNVVEITEAWNKERKMPDDVARQVNAIIMDNSVLEALLIAKDLHLPPPVPLNPALYQQQQAYKPKRGVAGPEIA